MAGFPNYVDNLKGGHEVTEFSDDGAVVARRYWGGLDRGTVVELTVEAVHVPTFDTPLEGSDGSFLSLRQLADFAGRNKKCIVVTCKRTSVGNQLLCGECRQ